ncbi:MULTISPECIES: helix-turn-helix domain-containing protein [unclassified Paenibacillus]|uniref:helix-turn-helix domain-containing protein n=1 Tax=unclassified Paenibacillus TaxID=185978 RepID=UPI0036421524
MTALSFKNRKLYLLSSIRRINLTNNNTTRCRTSPAPTLVLFTKGNVKLSTNDNLWFAEPLQLYYFPSGMHVEATIQSEEVDYYMLIIKPLTLSRSNKQWLSFLSADAPSMLTTGRISLRDTEQALLRFERLYEASHNSSDTGHLDLQLQEMLHFIEGQSLVQENTQPSDNGIELSIAYMQRHFHEKISRETLASIANLTPSSYCRSFKKAKGLAPTDYLNQIRIEQAKKRLASGHSIKEVAESVGYGNEYYLSRIFKKIAGIPPTLYVKRNCLRVAVASRFGFHDNLNSVGVRPVAMVDCYRHPGLQEADYERRLKTQLEELKIARPDLIIGDYSHLEHYEAFKRIAPTFILDFNLDWRVPHMKVAELVGREKEAQQTFIQLDKKITEARTRLDASANNKSVALLQIMHDHVMLQGTVNHPLNQLLYTELGLKPDKAAPINKMRLELFPQDVPKLTADHLWIRMYMDHTEVDQTFAKIRKLDFWNSIPAVQHNKIRFISNWLIMSWTPQGRNKIIDEVIELVAPDATSG